MVSIQNCSYNGPDTLDPNEEATISVSAEVRNNNSDPFDYRLALSVGSQRVAEQTASIAATTTDTVTVSGVYTAPGSGSDFDIDLSVIQQTRRQGGGGSNEPPDSTLPPGSGGGGGGGGSDGPSEPQLASASLETQTVNEFTSLRVRTTINHPPGESTVSVRYLISGFEMTTVTETVGAPGGSATTTSFIADIPYDTIRENAFVPDSGSTTAFVQAEVPGTGQSVGVGNVTLEAPSDGGGGSDEPPDSTLPPGSGGPGDGGGGSDEPDTPPEIQSITLSTVSVIESSSLRVLTKINNNDEQRNVTVIYSVAGREVATVTESVSRGSVTRFTADIPYARLESRGVTPSSGSLDADVSARLSGSSETVSANRQVTINAANDGGGGGGSDEPPDSTLPPGSGGPGRGEPEIESVGRTSGEVAPGDDLIVLSNVSHKGESDEVTVVWRVGGRDIGTKTEEIGPSKDPNNDGASTIQSTFSYSRLERRGVVPSSGTKDVTVEARLSGTDRWVEANTPVTIFARGNYRTFSAEESTEDFPGVGSLQVPDDTYVLGDRGYRKSPPLRRNARPRGR